jgi:hypothetical protein
MSFLVLVVEDEPEVEMLFRQQFRPDLREPPPGRRRGGQAWATPQLRHYRQAIVGKD